MKKGALRIGKGFMLFGILLITLAFPNLSVYAQWTAISLSDPEPALNAVHLISDEGGSVALIPSDPFAGAAATKYKWNTTYSSKFTVSGLVSESDTTYGDCTLYDNGTFTCYEDEHGTDRYYTGTYAYIGNTGYKIQFLFDSNGLQEYRDMLTGWVEDMAYAEGADIDNISFNFTSVKTSQVAISKKTGVPGKATLTIRGKISAILDGKYTTKNISFSSNITFQYAPPPQQYTLSIQKTGSGNGTVTSSPGGINCGSDCTETYNPGATLTLTAAAASGSIFQGWSGGGCSGTGTCMVTMDQNKTVTATFATGTPPKYTLTVQKSGSGGGAVTSSPSGINCGSDCSESYNASMTVTLTAAAASGSTFQGWSGGRCSGTGTCTVTMDQNTTVTATFTAAQALVISAPATSTGSFSVSVSYSWPPLSSSMDRYELEESTTSITSGFTNIQTAYGNVSPHLFSLTRVPGTYYYRARVFVGSGASSGYSPYSSAVQVVVTAPSRAITLQNNMSTGLNLHEIVQVKVAQTEAGVFTRNDLLTNDNSAHCLSLSGESIPAGSSRTYNITIGNDYWVFIGIGTWDMDNVLCSWSSPWFKRTFFTDTNFNMHYVWKTVHVQGHSSGNWLWTISGSYLNGTLIVYPQGGSPIYFNVTNNNPIP